VELFIEAFRGKFRKPGLYAFGTGSESSEINPLFLVIHCPPLLAEYRMALRSSGQTASLPKSPLRRKHFADNYVASSHNNPQKSSFKPPFRHVLFALFSSRKRPTEAETSRNSLSWTILQATPLF
jgi:hypothetical protein